MLFFFRFDGKSVVPELSKKGGCINVRLFVWLSFFFYLSGESRYLIRNSNIDAIIYICREIICQKFDEIITGNRSK